MKVKWNARVDATRITTSHFHLRLRFLHQFYQFRLTTRLEHQSCSKNINGMPGKTTFRQFEEEEARPQLDLRRHENINMYALCRWNSDIRTPHTIMSHVCLFFISEQRRQRVKKSDTKINIIFALEAINRLCNFLKCNAFYLIAISVI